MLQADQNTSSEFEGVTIRKTDGDEQIVYGEVYAPGMVDTYGDYMSEETIKHMAYEFMRRGLVNAIDVEHRLDLVPAYVVESFIARSGDDLFIPGSWVVGVKIVDPDLWAKVKNGEINGFSMWGEGVRMETTVELEIPDILTGETSLEAGHVHTFWVRYDSYGNFLGGETDAASDGHKHTITKGVVTDEALGHSHRFSYIEGVICVQSYH